MRFQTLASHKWFVAASLASALLGGAIMSGQLGDRSMAIADEKPAAKTQLLRHVVLFKFKESSSEADVQKVVDEFGKLKSKIPQIYAYEHGTENSPEGLADGFTHCFLVTFKSEADRAAYLPHADHLAFVDVLKPHLDKVLVVDYWTNE
ncbi:Dabb family protein [Rosistilla oblonga]|uniref:Dabb family protein n=1 Tax=Rosistilla oblonga TaxID=2527990 RepID=UPI003A97C679